MNGDKDYADTEFLRNFVRKLYEACTLKKSMRFFILCIIFVPFVHAAIDVDIHVPAEIYANQPFDASITLTNTGKESIQGDLWTYVYRGSKTYSGSKEQNKEPFLLEPKQSSVFTQSLTINDADPGNYSLKANVKTPDRKTVQEQRMNIVVLTEKTDNTEENTQITTAKVQNNEKARMERLTYYANPIYRSNQQRALTMLPLGMLILETLLCVYLITREHKLI